MAATPSITCPHGNVHLELLVDIKEMIGLLYMVNMMNQFAGV